MIIPKTLNKFYMLTEGNNIKQLNLERLPLHKSYVPIQMNHKIS